VTYLVERTLPRDLLILLWSPSGQQHVRLESPASSRHWGAWCPQPCKRVTPCRSHTNPQNLLLQKTLPCRRHTYPPASYADPCRSWNLCNLWDAQLKHLPEKVSAGAPSVLNLLMFSTYCMYCIATALHCTALHCFELLKLHVCNLIYPRCPLLQ